VEEIAGTVARLMNDDFGGLNLERLTLESPAGRWYGPRAQFFKRLFTLAPDWTESNIRTVVKMFQRGLEGQVYRAFWARIITKGALATLAFNLLAGAWDDDDFVERFKKAWKAGSLRWLGVDVTAVTNAMRKVAGMPIESGARTYISLIGHFKDPVKWATATGTAFWNLKRAADVGKAKGSVFVRFALDFANQENWRGQRFTTWNELFGQDVRKGRYVTDRKGPGGWRKRQPKWGKETGQFTTYRDLSDAERKAQGNFALGTSQTPSFLLHEARQVMPIQVQNFLAFIMGELDGIDAASGALGLPTRTIPASRFEEK